MKHFKLLTLVLAILLAIGFAGNAVAGGIEPPGISDECLQIMRCGEPDGLEKIGPYLKGTFTVSSSDDIFTIHLFLRWGRNYYLTNLETPVGTVDLCDLTDGYLIEAIAANGVICKESGFIQDAFNVTGVPVVKELIITDTGHCPAPNVITGRIIKGDITISMVPESAFTYDGVNCPEDPE